jgi:polyribonucleotide nucleotidyltransferase
MDNMDEHQLDLIVAGTESSVLMVESEAKELSEEIMLGAVEFGHKSFQPVIDAIREFAAEAGKPVWWQAQEQKDAFYQEIKNLIGQDLVDAYGQMEKQVRSKKLEEAKNKALDHFASNEQVDSNQVKSAIKKIEQDFVRMRALDGKRIDGRGPADIRNITCEVGVLPRTHGSALFTRGETQALVVTTLGTSFDEQSFDSLYGEGKQHFLMHYNFPPYSVGEISALRAPGRREIGHGKLAWRALNPTIPSKEAFPYTVRVVSEITESNGSSSMATVCGSSLAMMDAGVPLKSPIAGIAMGLIKEGDREVVLSDIMGDEDHLGDMDFKVAGSADGVTALQMDIKINGISFETMKKALSQAKAGREHILSKMAEALTDSRKSVHKNAPVVTTVKINPDKIRDLIGTGGKVIRALCEETGAKIEIDDTGNVKIAAPNNDVCNHAIARISEITAELEIGKVYNGKIVKIVDFGLFVSALGGKEGMVHVSEIRPERVENPATLFSEGDEVKVKIIGIERGKVKMSMKYIDQETGEEKPRSNSGNGNAGNSSNGGNSSSEDANADNGANTANNANASTTEASQESRPPRSENRRSPGGADRKRDYPPRNNGAPKSSRPPYEPREEKRDAPSSSPARVVEEKRKYFN